MEKYIQELEAERLEELEAYLLATGLKDTHLTEKEQEVLDKFEGGGMIWDNSKIVGIFDVNNTHSILSSQIISNSGNVPYVTASM